MKRKLSFLILVFIFFHCSIVLADPQSSVDQDFVKVKALLDKGLADQAIVLLKEAAKRATERHDERGTTEILLYLGHLYREYGQMEAYINCLFEAIPHAKNTDLEAVTDTEFYLASAELALKQRGSPLNILDLLSAGKERCAKIPGDGSRLSEESQELNLRISLYLTVTGLMGEQLNGGSAKDLTPYWQVFLTSALKEISPESLDPKPASHQTSLSADTLQWLDRNRPWDKSLLKMALQLNDRVMTLDRNRGAALKRTDLSDLDVAKDVDQRSEIYEQLGDLQQSLRLKKQALEVFDRYNIFNDAVITLNGICNFYLRLKTTDSIIEALKVSNELVFRIERQTRGLVGQTLVQFLSGFDQIYQRHFYLLLAQYKTLKSTSDADSNRALEQFILHADRMNFRPIRRDLAVYRELGDLIRPRPEILRSLDKQKQEILKREKERDSAAEQGKDPASFRPAPGIYFDDPYMALREAKKDLVSILEDAKRQNVGGGRSESDLPASLDEVRREMTLSDAIVMFIRQPSGQFLAAVIPSDRSPRLVELSDTNAAELKDLTTRVTRQVKLQDIKKTLERISEAIWRPLYPLPENLTVVLTPELIGIPFEALPLAAGEPVIARHKIRYSFGLAPGLGSTSKLAVYRRAFVIGAERFPDPIRFPPLPDSKEEVNGVRELFRATGMTIEPANALPQEAMPLFSQGSVFDIVHISTHSDLDEENDVPMADALVFPNDEVFAYNIALSPMRARLLVLSACALFKARRDSLNPISGITSAAMARIAPEVISTLWKVDPAGTRIFMLRFYDALLKEHDPSTALAITKRDFIDPSQLEKWLKSRRIPVPSEIQSYKEPYYWAPFVLTTGAIN
jgi:CHAT domain-containing protein/tetratricopeptide (TPR) repeat protein